MSPRRRVERAGTRLEVFTRHYLPDHGGTRDTSDTARPRFQDADAFHYVGEPSSILTSHRYTPIPPQAQHVSRQLSHTTGAAFGSVHSSSIELIALLLLHLAIHLLRPGYFVRSCLVLKAGHKERRCAASSLPEILS